MKTLLMFALFSGLSLSHAAVSENVKVRGTVTNLSADLVTLQTASGPVKVPREFFKEGKKNNLRPGKEAVADLPLVTLVDLNSHTEKK